MQFELMKKNREKIFIENSIYLRYDSEGEKVGFCGIARDITEMKKVEQKLKESEKKLRKLNQELEKKIEERTKELKESEKKYRNLVEETPDLIQSVKIDGSFAFINHAWLNTLGYTKEELPSLNLMDIIHPESKQHCQEIFLRVIAGESLTNINATFITKDGKPIYVEGNAGPHYSNDEIVETRGIFHDVTIRKKAEIIIKKEIEKLKELDQMRKDLITRVSHELKTPLVSIFSGSELLLNYYKDQMSDEIVKFIEIIHRGGQRLNYLIKNLLDISRIEYDKLKLNREKGNLVEIIKNCIDDIKYLAKQRNLSWSIDLPEKIYLEFDKIRFEQVISNLLSNAIKNTPSNGNIYISLKEKENHIYITIKDTGVGLTEKEMEKIFKKFGKIERYGKELDVNIEGSGLGLYISKEIVNLHEGQIWAESEGRNKGSTFIIKLPIKM
jgi:PAS domain S-box-containing protein